MQLPCRVEKLTLQPQSSLSVFPRLSLQPLHSDRRDSASLPSTRLPLTTLAKTPTRMHSHHSHSGQFCRHAKDNLEDVVKEAVRQGFTTFGLSEHAPRYREQDLFPEEVSRKSAISPVLLFIIMGHSICSQNCLAKLTPSLTSRPRTCRGSISTSSQRRSA